MACTLILSTVASQEEADTIGAVLLEKRAAACVQMMPLCSMYHWKGNIERSNEILLIIKTTEALYPHVESLIREHHSYEVPQIVQLPIIGGLSEYLSWITTETNS